MRCMQSFSIRLFPSRFLAGLLAVLLALVMPSLVFATPKPDVSQPALTDLSEIKHDFFDSLKVSKALKLQSASKVYVETANVEFSKYWEREHRTDVSGMYKENTRERFSRVLQEKVAEACEQSPGFELVANKAEADLVVLPRLDNLNIYAPDDFIGKSWVYRAGYGRYKLLVQDAKTGETLVEFIDGRETVDRGFSQPIEANRGTNTRDFRILMEKWSQRSFEYLEELKAK